MSKMLHKGFAVLCSIMMLSTVLVGCGSKEEAQSKTEDKKESTTVNAEVKTEEAKPAEKATVTLLMDKDFPKEGVDAVIAQMEKDLNIVTELEIIPGGAEGENIRKTRLATGDMTDICFFNTGSLLPTLNPEQNFLDITDEAYMANVDEGFKVTAGVNGKVYGIPASSSMVGGWLYNKKIYEELGLSVPKTWAELMENCEKIKAAGKTAVIGSYKDDWTSQLILLADYYNVQAENPNFAADYTANKAKFATTPVALRGFEKLQEVSKRGFLNKDALATTYDIALKMLAEGSGAHYPMLTFALPTIEASFPDKIQDIGVFAQPGDNPDKNGLTVWMPNAFYINKNSEKLDVVKKWAEYYLSEKGIAAYASAVKPVGPFVIKGAKLPEDSYAGVKDMLPYFDAGKTAPALEFVSAVKGPNLPQITIECGSDLRPAEECAAIYDKDVEKQAKQLGLAGW
ncbi:MAG: extracellular solute-binding protein family 1 [Clostridia bacterium]|jgi:raffinose/stachyose/melibiose transport system substrate-binding protein|nr:extracellular solute-binding protein family 1 [Clostridia bacterium]